MISSATTGSDNVAVSFPTSQDEACAHARKHAYRMMLRAYIEIVYDIRAGGERESM
jgi:hypothetical protein